MISKDGLVDLTRWVESTRIHDPMDLWRVMQTLPWYTWMLMMVIPAMIVWFNVDDWRTGLGGGGLTVVRMAGALTVLAVEAVFVSFIAGIPAATTVGMELEHAYDITDLACVSSDPCGLDSRHGLPADGADAVWRTRDGVWHKGVVIVRDDHVGIMEEKEYWSGKDTLTPLNATKNQYIPYRV